MILMPNFLPCSDFATAMSSMWPARAHEWMNLASMRREPTPTILSWALTMTIVKYESLRLRSHSKRSTNKLAVSQKEGGSGGTEVFLFGDVAHGGEDREDVKDATVIVS